MCAEMLGWGVHPSGARRVTGMVVDYAHSAAAELLRGRSPIPAEQGEVQMVQKSSSMQKTGDGVSPPTVLKSSPPQPRLPKGSDSVRGSVKPTKVGK